MQTEQWEFEVILKQKIAEYPNWCVYKAIKTETDRLVKQRCPFCSGWGHSGKDCPTDYKLSQLCGGVREQTQVIQFLRKSLKTAMPN